VSASLNPYATPRSTVADEGAGSEAEAVRTQHITHEASVKAVGVLFMLGGLLTLIVAAAGLLAPATAGGAVDGMLVAAGLAVSALSIVYLGSGWGLRALRPWARVPAVVLAAIGLLGFPIGTLINAYILWLLLSRKGRTVLSAEYAAVVKVTPHIKYRTSIVVWAALGMLGLLLLFAFFAAFVR
jgi:hypothetical protein